MPWLQLRLKTRRDDVEHVEDALLAAGALSITLQDSADEPILEPALGETPLWQETTVIGLFDATLDTEAAQQQLSSAIPQLADQLRWEQLEDKDWQREWMKHYQPIHCGGELWICPSWLTPPNPEAVNLLLDPGLAFGTGTHPTTLQCLQWLAKQDVSGKTIVDYGCGSGILAIAALLMGAKSAHCVDIDPQALLATQDNAERNGIANTTISTALPADCQVRPYDVVFANILAGPLVELAPTLTQLTQSGGLLCLSGILDNQADTVKLAYASKFEFIETSEMDHWVQLAAVRRTKK